MKSLPKLKLYRNALRKKNYIIMPFAKKLTKRIIMQSWNLFEYCLSILIGTRLASRISHLVIICLNPHEKLIKFKLG